MRTEEKSRRISNLIAINQQYQQLWKELYDRPKLARVLRTEVDLKKHPVSDEEELFVNSLILHLGTVFRATREGMFVQLEGVRTDIHDFFSLPIPKAVWTKSQLLQNRDFAAFIESSLNRP